MGDSMVNFLLLCPTRN